MAKTRAKTKTSVRAYVRAATKKGERDFGKLLAHTKTLGRSEITLRRMLGAEGYSVKAGAVLKAVRK